MEGYALTAIRELGRGCCGSGVHAESVIAVVSAALVRLRRWTSLRCLAAEVVRVWLCGALCTVRLRSCYLAYVLLIMN